MPAIDDHRPFQVTSPLGPDVLLFSRLTGDERLSEPFRYEITVVSESGDIDGNELLGQPVAVECVLPSTEVKRHFHGLVTEFSQLDYGVRFHEYRLTLRPWYWFLTQTADCRVFQGLTVPEIFEKVVKQLGFSDFRLNLKGTYQKVAYCVQYRETAFNFLSRLLEQEGIYYFFEHTTQKHTLVLVDDSSTHKATACYETVPYFPPTTKPVIRERDHLEAWRCVRTVQPGAYATTDFDFKTPATSLLKKQERALKYSNAKFEIFDYPADLPIRVDTDPTALVTAGAEHWVNVRLQELQSGHLVAQGHGDAVGLAAGTKFALEKYPRESFNRDYLIVGTRLSLAWNPYETGQGGTSECHIAVDAIELQTQYRPARATPKPVMQGGQTATVVGRPGEEIDTDEFGRIKVQFHWDREGKKNQDSSCRMRVAQAWAGKNWGAMHIPRVGQEVVVSFLEGDPDRPIVTGAVYNGEQKPPYELPANATQSGIKTHSSKGGGEKNFNEIRFEDKRGEETLHIHAEKDLTIDVENDVTWRVGLNNEDKEKLGTGNVKLIVGKTVDAKVDESINVKVTNKFVKVDAGTEITLVTGQSTINMKKDGTITIDCKTLQVKASSSIEMKASNSIKMDASNSIEMKANAAVKIEAAQVEVKGAMAKVDASGMLDLSAGGIASLKGALTKIG